MKPVDPNSFVTPAPWAGGLQHATYGPPETYRRAAAWLRGCMTIADWGGANGAFRGYLPPWRAYTVVDGTAQHAGQILADLTTYRAPVDGILLRHVLDLNSEWRAILDNAVASFRQRMVAVTFMPESPTTRFVKMKSGWALQSFCADDLRRAMAPHLVHDEIVLTTHSEHVYYLERR